MAENLAVILREYTEMLREAGVLDSEQTQQVHSQIDRKTDEEREASLRGAYRVPERRARPWWKRALGPS